MLKARPAKEVVVKMQNEVGVLHQITKLIADKGINILAASTWVQGDQAVVHLVTDDNLRVLDALRGLDHGAREADVVAIETAHKPGMLRQITGKLAEANIDIHHLYASATASQDRCLVVFSTANNDKAIVLLNAS